VATAQTVSLDGVYKSTSVTAQFDVLFALADAMAPSLPLLLDVVDDWDFVVDEAAQVFAVQSPQIQTLSDAIPIWDIVLKALTISRFPPKAKVLLNDMTARLTTAVQSSGHGVARLEAAHQKAVEWIQELGQNRNISLLEQASPYPLLVTYDPDGIDFCASSSRLAGQIGWSLQLVQRALYGALIVDMFLAHEYLSHMLPRNTHLSWNVREVWLSSALFWEMKSQPGNPLEQHVMQFCWEQFRFHLNSQFDPGNRKFFGPRQVVALAESTYLVSEDIFWDISTAMLECADYPQNAQAIDALLKGFMSLGQNKLAKTLRAGPGRCDLLNTFHRSLLK
jgi:hypothetical protein